MFTGVTSVERQRVELHRAARIEDAINDAIERRLRLRGWKPTVTPYTGYGAPGWVLVLGRVLLARFQPKPGRHQKKLRGWRSFTTFSAAGAPVTIEAGGVTHHTVTDRGGFIDTVVEAPFE